LNNPKAPWYITNGNGGHYDGLESLPAVRQPYSRFGLDTKNASAAYGWSKLTFHNCTHLTHEFVSARDGKILDTATLFKNRTCAVTKSVQTNSTASNSATAPVATGGSNGLAVSILSVVICAVLSVLAL
jgi:hypothetical protein